MLINGLLVNLSKRDSTLGHHDSMIDNEKKYREK